MNILITGANGFIGAQITSDLILAGHQVILGVRDVKMTAQRFPHARVCYTDFNQMLTPEHWQAHLTNIDVVINCVGLLQSNWQESIINVQSQAPQALFAACAEQNIKRVIQLSAVGADEAAHSEFALTKKATDDYLRTLAIDWVIVKPSLVYGSGAYGGTALLRALAGLPAIIPLVGAGNQPFMPVHIHDVSQLFCKLVDYPEPIRSDINIVGPEILTLREILCKTRHWLGFGHAVYLNIPLSLIKVVAFLGQYLGKGPVNPTSVKMLSYGNTAKQSDFLAKIQCKPRTFDQGLQTSPSQTQDRWHARLYFLGPLLRITLGLFWLISGIIPLLTPLPQSLVTTLQASNIPSSLLPLITIGTPWLDIILGTLTLINIKLRWVLALQCLVILGYTFAITLWLPSLWLDPFGSVVKNIPILIATLVMLALTTKR